ncbi:MAG: putative Ig domain-containing protein, partial [bacterium]|nr:putative Ig domain-containing protein [bacterium]
MSKTKTSSRLKILLAMLAAAVAFGLSAAGGIKAYADDSGTAVTIGDGTSTQYNIPYCSYYKNGGVETLYTADEIGMAGSIQSIAYNVDSGGPNQATSVKFYMGHTTATSLNSTALAPDDGWTLVYSGAPSLGSSTGWETIAFDEPFEYDGESNLLVLMVRQSNSDTKVNYYCTSAEGVVIYKQSDSDSATYADSASFMGSSAYSVASSRPNTQFVIEEDTGEGAPIIKTTSLPSCNLGEAYSATIKVKANPAATVTVSGLPAGLAFDAETLTISGTPTEAGTFPVTITAANGFEPDATATLSLAITTEAPAITTESLPNGKVGKAYSATIEATGVPAPTISVSGLPEGLAFDETTNTISGTPAEAGEASVTVTAHNGYGDDAVQTFAFTIKSATASEEIEVEIGTGTTSATQGNGVPFHTYYKNSVTQSIYSAEEIAFEGQAVDSGTINAISYNVSAPVSSGVAFTSLDIYMGYTNETTPSSTGLAMSERTLVYSATNGTIGSEAGWERIELSTPFEYDSSNGNLVIMVVRSASSYNGSLGYYATAGKTGLYADDNTAKTDPDAAISAISKTVNYRANIKLDMEIGAAVPKFSVNPEGFTYKAGDPQSTALSATAASKAGAPLSFVWYKSDNGELADAAAVIANATAVTESAEGTAADGGFASTYTPDASDLAAAGTVYYYCVATDTVGSAASKPAAIQVYTEDAQAPVGDFAISSDPAAEDGVVTAGETTTVAFNASGAQVAAVGDQLYYQWYKKGEGDTDFVAIEGATEESYVATVAVGDTDYQCRVHASHQIETNVSADVASNTITIHGTALTITTAEELASFRDAVNAGDTFNGRTVLLGADIDISNVEGGWTCIGLASNAKRFAGTFDGQGHTITIGAISTSTTGSAVGLFGYVRGEATIKNLTVAGSIESDQYNVAAVANTSYGATFENVRNLANVSTTDTSGRVAGIVASVGAGGADDPTAFINCVNKGNISTSGSSGYASGIANLGATSGGCIATFENCYNLGTISGKATMSGDCYISGIVSINKSNNNANTLTNCYNAGVLSGGDFERGYGLATKATLVGSNYYLEGAPDGGIGTSAGDGAAVAKTADEMASADFLALLGSAFVAGSELDPAQATPGLAWEKADAPEPEVPAELQLSKLEFHSSSSATSALRELDPEFDSATKTYTVVAAANLGTLGYAFATLADSASGTITAVYPHATSGAEQTKTITSGGSGVSLANSLASNSFNGNTVTIKVDGQEAYIVNIVRQANLNTLVVKNGDETVVLSPTFAQTTYEYTANVPADAQLAVTPTISNTALGNAAILDVAGQSVDNKGTATVTPVWTDRGYDLVITVSGPIDSGAINTVYTIHCTEQPATLVIATPPTKTTYDAGESFDPAGMTLKATFADGGEKVVGADEFTYTPSGALKMADNAIIASYGGLTVEQPITINSPFEGSGTQEDPFLIKTASDYDTIKAIVAGGDTLAGAYLKQDADITLSSDWTPIGTSKDNCFSGNLDGGNHTVTVPADCRPLLGFVNGATVSNLNIYGERIAGAGLVDNMQITGVNTPALTLDNITLKSGSSTLRSGLVDCVPPVNPYGAVSAGFMTTIANCTVEEGVTVGYGGDLDYIGGFAGRFQGVIENSTCNATVKGGSYVGGFVGMRANSMGTPVGVSNSTFGGSVVATGDYVGGIAGAGYVNSTAPNAGSLELVGNSVTGSVTGGNKVGGILGGNAIAQTWDNTKYQFKDNTFTGALAATADEADAVGAIAGYYRSLNKFDDISGNLYASDCGAAKAFGKVDYVDTNCETHETESGALYFSTENDTSGCPSVSGCSWRKAHNRTDDPLGADAENLAKAIPSIDPSDQEAVDAVAAQFTGYAFPIRYANGYTNVADAVKDVMKDYDAWQEGMTVTLKSCGETEALDSDGTIHYKESAFGYVNVENVSDCVFTVELNGATADTDGRTVQIGWNLDYFKAQMQAEADAFTADLIKEENESLDAVTSDLFLCGSGATNVGSSWSVVEWTSSNPDVIAI